MKYIRISIFASIMFLFIGCDNNKQDTCIVIVETTDIHGNIFPYDFIYDEPLDYSLASVCTYVDSLRDQYPEGVVLLDNGDFFQGQPTVYYYNFEDTSSTHVGVDALNYMAYDAMTIGNHDLETGHKVYDKINRELNAPVLAANIINTKTHKPYFNPYTIIERNGVKIAVLGLITPAIPDWLPEDIWRGMEFEDMVESAKKWMKEIKEKESPDLIVGLFHAGVDYTYNNQDADTFKNENATQLVAEQVPGFDIVFAGHDHKLWNKTIVNVAGDTVYLLGSLNGTKTVSTIKIDFKYCAENDSWNKAFTPEIVFMNEYESDKAFIKHFSEQFSTVKNYVDQKVCDLENTLSTHDAYFGNSALIDLIHNVQFRNSDAQVSFTSPLTFNATINKGDVLVRDLFKVYRYENLLYTISLTGNEIDKYLEYSAGLWFNQMKNRDDHLLLLKQNDEGKYFLKEKYYNLSSASGIEYVVDVSKPVGKKVQILGFSDGSYFYKDSVYKVALNSYRGSGGGGHLTIGVGLSKDEITNRLVGSTEHDLRYLLMEYFNKEKTVSQKSGNNWRIIPEDFYEWGKNKDSKLIFE